MALLGQRMSASDRRDREDDLRLVVRVDWITSRSGNMPSKAAPTSGDIASEAAKLRQLSTWVSKLGKAIDTPTLMSGVPVILGRSFNFNFNMEGTIAQDGKKWQKLSKMTKAVRADRKMGTKILRQSGGLHGASARSLMGWSSGESLTQVYPAAYENSGDTTIAASYSPKNFKAAISGPKVLNQIQSIPSSLYIALATGVDVPRYGAGYVPARPFWYLNATLVNGVGDSILKEAMTAWYFMSDRNIVKRTGGWEGDHIRGNINGAGS